MRGPRSTAARVLGKGTTVAEWIATHPDRFVTRRDVALMFQMFEHAQRAARRRNRWYRRLWRWLWGDALAPAQPKEEPTE